MDTPQQPQVYTAAEIARAAGVRRPDVRTLVRADIVRPHRGGFFSECDAVTAVRALSGVAGVERPLFRPPAGVRREPGLPLITAAALHVTVAALLLMTTLGTSRTIARVTPADAREMRMVFLIAPGPGGGGGGGGHQDPAPPPPAARKGVEKLRSPIPIKRPPPPPRIEPPPVVKKIDPPPVKIEPAVVAPVVPMAADPTDRVGIPWKAKPAPVQEVETHGPGIGGGTGTGSGTGVGEGQGAGIGPGSGGGTGGGPYRPGSGITAPSIEREVKPDYTEEGRRRNLEGDVDLEIVVKSDGSVGSVKLLHGLGAGLDERAMDAVRQWRFNPAHRFGQPVDVIVEVSVEFKLR
jgi:protein TonB